MNTKHTETIFFALINADFTLSTEQSMYSTDTLQICVQQLQFLVWDYADAIIYTWTNITILQHKALSYLNDQYIFIYSWYQAIVIKSKGTSLEGSGWVDLLPVKSSVCVSKKETQLLNSVRGAQQLEALLLAMWFCQRESESPEL